MADLLEQIQFVQTRIQEALMRSNNAEETVQLIAVSKSQPVQAIVDMYQAGLRSFAENKLQEALPKIKALSHLCLTWHFIGPLQSNKTKNIATHFDWVQSLSRLSDAKRLNDHRPADRPPLNVLIQVNISHDSHKVGITQAEITTFAEQLQQYPRLRLRGLMTVPKQTDITTTREDFSALAECFRLLQSKGWDVDTLSMGMSNDFEIAIECGATMVRIGTLLFGVRQS